MNSAIFTNLFKLWMGKKHDRQGPLAYIVELLFPFFRASYIKKDEPDGYGSCKQ